MLQQQGVLTAIAPNLVEGREFNNPQAVALDTSVTPPILYVADFGNNRVLAWKNASAFTKGDYADLAIGQRDLLSTAPEGPGGDLSTGLSSPVALTVDATRQSVCRRRGQQPRAAISGAVRAIERSCWRWI